MTETIARAENAHVSMSPQLRLMIASLFLNEICIPLLTPGVSWSIYSD
ncbi:hypothetical protein [Methylosinus sp. Sm6]|nr:hypothetical protein [Methylosinus sp. Sm6]MBY6241870.1 hypothetical protein [Methylosinus sp. Sm6]